MTPPTGPASTATTARSKVNFSFLNDARKVLLVQCVREHDAHIAGHGRKDATFKLVLSTFLAHVPCKMWETHNEPNVKTLRDKFENLV